MELDLKKTSLNTSLYLKILHLTLTYGYLVLRLFETQSSANKPLMYIIGYNEQIFFKISLFILPLFWTYKLVVKTDRPRNWMVSISNLATSASPKEIKIGFFIGFVFNTIIQNVSNIPLLYFFSYRENF